MKVIGAFLLLIGLVLFALALLVFSELRTVPASSSPTSPDSLPLTEIISPELFAPGATGIKSAALVRIAIPRMYMLGGLALVMIAGGVFAIFMGKSPKRPPTDSSFD
jgi:hypothetical protein